MQRFYGPKRYERQLNHVVVVYVPFVDSEGQISMCTKV